MKPLTTALVLLLVFVAGGAGIPAHAQDPAPLQVATLDNGLTVIVQEDPALPLVAVSVFYRVGSAHEPPGRSGFAHLFEHLMFTGTKRVPDGGFDEILEANGGWSNASTAEDYTEYHQVGPAHLLETMLWLEADRMEELGHAVTQAKLDIQREVVRNERREGYDNAPYGPAEILLYERMFPDGHAYHDHVIGSHEDLQKATLADVKAFFDRHYVPNNASIAIVGDVDAKKVLASVERLFGSIPAGEAAATPSRHPAPRATASRLTLRDDVRLGRVTFAWHTPPFYEEHDAELDLLAAILADGRSSRLWRRLMHEEALATEVDAWQESRRLGSLFCIQVQAAGVADLPRIEDVVREELQRLRSEAVPAAELARARATFLQEMVAVHQRLEDRAEYLNLYFTYLGSPDRFAWDLDRYRRVTPAALRETASHLLQPERSFTLTVLPEGKGSPRDVRPKVEAASTFRAPVPETFRLENGLEVWLLRRPGLPLVAARMLMPGGTRGSTRATSGIPALAARMHSEGAGERGPIEFVAAAGALGTYLSVWYDRSATSVGLEVMREHADEAFGLLADALLRPRYDPAAFEDLRARHASWVRMALDEPDRIARDLGPRIFLQSKAPAYGQAIEGSPLRAEAAPIELVRAHATQHFVPEGATLLLAGDLDVAAARELATKHFGTWSGKAATRRAPSVLTLEPSKHRVRRVVIVDRPGAPQTQVRFVMPAPAWEDADRVPVQVVTSVLGGAFTSRLMQVLREENGLTYSSYARYVPLRGVGYLDLDTAVETDDTRAALDAMLRVVEGIRSGDITDPEAKKAVATLKAERITGLQTLQGVLDTYEIHAAQGESASAFAEESERLRRPALEDPGHLNAFARTWIRPRAGVLVLVGDRGKIAAQLRGLDLPAPEFWTAEDALER